MTITITVEQYPTREPITREEMIDFLNRAIYDFSEGMSEIEADDRFELANFTIV